MSGDFSINYTFVCSVRSGTRTVTLDIFLIPGDIVAAAGGNYSTLAVTGGVVAIHIQWVCNLDFDFYQNCLPR